MKANSFIIALLLAALSLLFIVVTSVALISIAAIIDQSRNKASKQTVYHTQSDTEFALRDGIVSFPTRLQQCVSDSDCVVVANHCGGCSCGDEISNKQITRYHEQFSALCGIYFDREQIVTCDIYCKPRGAKCIEGICSS